MTADKINNLEEAEELVNNRTVEGLIFLPNDLTNATITGSNVTITVYSDPSEPAIGGSIFAALFSALDEVSADFGHRKRHQ